MVKVSTREITKLSIGIRYAFLQIQVPTIDNSIIPNGKIPNAISNSSTCNSLPQDFYAASKKT